MGQIFHACAYDIETKTRCIIDADKFHANCYAHSGTVLSMHYLLRQKPYHVMWKGDYAIDKVKFIENNVKRWKSIDVMDEAIDYFDWSNTHSVQYSGYLLNHTKKQAINLADYHRLSKFIHKTDMEMAIDLVPVLTETGGGTQMALYDGVSDDSTEELAGQWCGDLLQIMNESPEDYQIVRCCFAEIWSRVKYCYLTFGVNKADYLLKNSNGELFKSATLNLLHGKRMDMKYIKVERNKDNKMCFHRYDHDQTIADLKQTIANLNQK